MTGKPVSRPLVPSVVFLLAIVVQPIAALPLNAEVRNAVPFRAAVLQSFPDLGASLEPPSLIQANLFIEDVGGNVRIASAGKLRMLSQRISSAACNHSAGIAPDQTLEILTAAKAEFRKILDALTKGDDGMGIFGPEAQRKTLEAIQRVETLWGPFDAAVDGVIAGQGSTQIAFIAANNEALLSEANILTSEISSEYANPAEMSQANAMVIDIAGRQRMLTQKVAKEACGIATANAALGTVEALTKTMGLYEASLNALLNGMPEAGVIAPPSEDLRLKLEVAVTEWTATKAVLAKLVETGSATAEEQEVVFQLMNAELARMIEIVNLYTEQAKTKI